MSEEKNMSYVVDHFGSCPECGRTDGYLNVGCEHWFHCDDHKTKWLVGSNLFSSWRYETEEVWEENAVRISDYAEVKPTYFPWPQLDTDSPVRADDHDDIPI